MNEAEALVRENRRVSCLLAGKNHAFCPLRTKLKPLSAKIAAGDFSQ
jgi:hypothetical protein